MCIRDSYDPTLQCVDVETDFNYFYLKFVKDAHLVEPGTPVSDLQYEVRMVRHDWRNRISMNTAQLKKSADVWDMALSKRICRHFKIYTQIANFSMYILVSHRNMISVYDMTKKKSTKWLE